MINYCKLENVQLNQKYITNFERFFDKYNYLKGID